jgi:hypothetical protein
MKKMLVLILTLVLLVSFASLSFAAVTVGGNLRVWYLSSKDEASLAGSTMTEGNGFKFDRLALTFASELSTVDGFKGEVQFRKPVNDATNGSDLRVDNAYYYQKGMFFESDEMDIGYIQQLPFKGGPYNAILIDSLANTVIKDTNSLGVKYSNKINQQFDFALAVLNGKNKAATDDTDYEGKLDYGFRLNYAPISQMKVGLAYVNDCQYTASVDTSKQVYVVDAVYANGPFGAYVECLSGSRKNGNNDVDIDPATYLELSYKVADPLTVYAGGTTGLDKNETTSITYASTYKISSFNSANDKQFYDNWTVFGCKYQLTPKAALQAEYLAVDSDKKLSTAGLRFMVSF